MKTTATTPTETFKANILAAMDSIGGLDSGTGYMDTEAVEAVNREIADEVAQDVWDCADRNGWNEDDVRFAIGRVIRKRLEMD